MNLIESLKKEARKMPPENLFPDLTDADYTENSLRITIAKEITRRRKELGLSQSDLAKLVGVSQPMISQYESGDYNFTLETLCKVFAAIQERPGMIFSNFTRQDDLPQNVVSLSSTRFWKSSSTRVDLAEIKEE